MKYLFGLLVNVPDRFHDNSHFRLESNERETGSVADGEVYIQLANQFHQDSLKNPVSLKNITWFDFTTKALMGTVFEWLPGINKAEISEFQCPSDFDHKMTEKSFLGQVFRVWKTCHTTQGALCMRSYADQKD